LGGGRAEVYGYLQDRAKAIKMIDEILETRSELKNTKDIDDDENAGFYSSDDLIRIAEAYARQGDVARAKELG